MTLTDYIIKQKWRFRDVANLLGVSDAAVSAWRKGSRFPSRKNIAKLVKLSDGAITGAAKAGDFYPSTIISEVRYVL